MTRKCVTSLADCGDDALDVNWGEVTMDREPNPALPWRYRRIAAHIYQVALLLKTATQSKGCFQVADMEELDWRICIRQDAEICLLSCLPEHPDERS